MKGENGTPVTPDWSPESRSWCTSRSGSCGAVCETTQHCIWLGGTDEVDPHWDGRGEN